MCGYFGYLEQRELDEQFFKQLNIQSYPRGRRYNRQVIDGLITVDSAGKTTLSSPIWWYQQKLEKKVSAEDRYVPDWRYTTFNARDLESRFWRKAVRTRRGIFVASEFGESEDKRQFLFRSKAPIVLGAVYKDWDCPMRGTFRSCAVITRPPHPQLEKYHSKSTPFFLPNDPKILREWLDPNVENSSVIDALLSEPRLYNDFLVQQVKTYKDAVPVGDPEELTADGQY